MASSQDYTIEYIRTQIELLGDEETGMTYWLAEMYECIEEWRLAEGQRLIQSIKGLTLSSHSQGLFYLGAGDLYSQAQAWPDAATAYRKALVNFRALDNQDDIALVLNQLALTLQQQQEYEEAILFYKETITIHETLGNVRQVGRALVNLGSVADKQAIWRQSIAYYQQAVQYFRQIDAKDDLATALNNLGVAFECLGDFTEAEDYYMHCVDLLDDLGETYSAKGIRILGNLGQLYTKQKAWKEAENCHQWALEICQTMEDLYSESTIRNNLGTVYSTQKEYHKAVECYLQSIQLHHQLGDKQGEALVLRNLGAAYADINEPDLAETCYRNSLLVSQELDDLQGIARNHNNLGVLYETRKEFDIALSHYRDCATILQSLEDGHAEVTTLLNICTLYASGLVQPEAIEPYFERAWKISTDRQYTDHLAALCMLRGDIAFQHNRLAEAFQWCAEGCRHALQLNAPLINQISDHLLLHIARLQNQNRFKELCEFHTMLLKIWSEATGSTEKPQILKTLGELVAITHE